jgi:hypothetical protein
VGLNCNAFGNSAQQPISASFLQSGPMPQDVGGAVSAASNTASMTQMSQLRALVEEPASLAGRSPVQHNLTAEEQLASLLASNHASGPPAHTLPAMPPSQPDMHSQNVGMDMQSQNVGMDMQSQTVGMDMQSVLGQLHSKDALNALFSGGLDASAAGGDGGLVKQEDRNSVEQRNSPDQGGSFQVQRLLDGARDAWPSLPMQNMLLEEPRGHAGL